MSVPAPASPLVKLQVLPLKPGPLSGVTIFILLILESPIVKVLGLKVNLDSTTKLLALE